MFTQFFFLFLSLMLIGLSTDTKGFTFWIDSSTIAWILGIFIYGICFLWFIVQTKLSRQLKISVTHLNLATQIELLIFLGVYQFGLGAHRLLLEYTNFASLASCFSLILYLGGLGWHYHNLGYYKLVRVSSSYAYHQLQFLFPFCLPFIIFGLLIDGLNLVPYWSVLQQSDTFLVRIATILFDVVLLMATLTFMPPIMMLCWRCQPLKNSQLIKRLETVCQHLNFKHAGLKTWTVMKHSLTAGIIGILPRFRYVMFTEKLLERFTTEELEAIFVHEIGHSRHRHLLYYPFILLGMLLVGMLLLTFMLDPLFEQSSLMQKSAWPYLLSFIIYALTLAFYFRVVFGFFSRLFERQADLQIFECSLSPTHLIQALDRIGIISGNTHYTPNWHHFSIQERIDFLQSVIENPNLIEVHHQKVKMSLIIYFILLGIGSITISLYS